MEGREDWEQKNIARRQQTEAALYERAATQQSAWQLRQQREAAEAPAPPTRAEILAQAGAEAAVSQDIFRSWATLSADSRALRPSCRRGHCSFASSKKP